MTKSDLIEHLARKYVDLTYSDVDNAVNVLLDVLTETLARGERVEIRGFGSFSVRFRAARMARNPKTGQSVPLDGKFVPHFRCGKELRDRINQGL